MRDLVIKCTAGAEEPERHVPAGLARRAGALIERAWERDLFGLRSRGVGSDDGEPPLTEFLAE